MARQSKLIRGVFLFRVMRIGVKKNCADVKAQPRRRESYRAAARFGSNQIADYRENGYGYKRIGKLMGIPANTIKAYCIRNGIGAGASEEAEQTKEQPEIPQCHCEQCGKPITQIPKQKKRRFCSDHCRNLWWNSHLDQVNRKANYEFTCACCGKAFTAYGNKNRKYCGRECYFTARYGGERDGNSGK